MDEDRPIRVTIAEDSAVLRDGLVKLLVDRGFDVIDAVSDPDALEKVGRKGPPRCRGRRHQDAAHLHR